MNLPTKSDIRSHLLEAGVRLIRKRGYHATGVNDLVSEAGIPKGSFYHYFSSKEQFAAEAIIEYIGPFLRRLDAIQTVKDESTLDKLRRYFAEMIEDFERDPGIGGCMLGNLLGEIGDTSVAALDAMDQAVTAYRAALCRLLQEAQRQGEVRDDLAAEQLANLLFDAWQGALLRVRVDRSNAPLKQFEQCTFDSLLLKAP